ncbi:DUF4258 domain-containing protein [candidate division TA06 bacterium]|uniref:DUF4258 domain-containing protein n=1 Tax=candidate division TA06 bacterium TaxID=2250710 RepID=A0A523XN36_UNCT6|nr:MAG: DUF4258 domain-containing protein [candidate division TA06 bacterium]
MIEYQFSDHAYDMLNERNIREAWVKSTMEDPEKKESKDDGTVHYIKPIEEHGGRYLRVVVNPNVKPLKIVTLYLNRRIRRSW